jgi:hypothetical protein
VTASEPAPSEHPGTQGARSIAERALDALVYLPAGAILGALEDVPRTLAKGRARVDQELRNAKFIGRVVVQFGVRRMRAELESLAGEGRPEAETAPRTETAPRERHRQHREPAREPAAARPRPAAVLRDPDVDRAIPDYDILAASQVVRRLDGLGHDELRAVVRHERATRSRRTILRRAEQLLGTGAAT